VRPPLDLTREREKRRVRSHRAAVHSEKTMEQTVDGEEATRLAQQSAAERAFARVSAAPAPDAVSICCGDSRLLFRTTGTLNARALQGLGLADVRDHKRHYVLVFDTDVPDEVEVSHEDDTLLGSVSIDPRSGEILLVRPV